MNEDYYIVGYQRGDGTVRLIPGYMGSAYETPEEAIREAEDEFSVNPDALVFQLVPYCTEDLDPW